MSPRPAASLFGIILLISMPCLPFGQSFGLRPGQADSTPESVPAGCEAGQSSNWYLVEQEEV
jgi:hypothetical protein